LKPEWWGSPLAQGEKYQGRKKTCDKRYDDDDDDDDDDDMVATQTSDKSETLTIREGYDIYNQCGNYLKSCEDNGPICKRSWQSHLSAQL
jgi:hypothetical protein